jgi:hypothetical protein
MADSTKLVTVFRSADDSAEEDARAISEMLSEQGLHPVLLDDSAPEVPEGAWEVHVPADEVEKAESLIDDARLPEDDFVEVDDSPELDLETVFSSSGPTAEFEAIEIQSLLEDAGIATVLVGNSTLPNLPFEVRVAKEHVERAIEVIREAEAAGPAAAEELERATEAQN